MKGADRVIRLRMTGWQPRSVLVRIAKAPPPKRVPPSLREDFAALDDEHPTVYTDGTTPETADLRWCLGLLVHVVAEPETPSALFDRWVDAVASAQPAIMGMIGPQGEVAEWRP